MTGSMFLGMSWTGGLVVDGDGFGVHLPLKSPLSLVAKGEGPFVVETEETRDR